ncbi:infB [Ophiophagus hannah]|uniref:InfB n=1 Tax=Ophiophagus hannah TaxID=8665 RepID=V8NVM3_OPHHA|nr:infB [Ophiophagus hannah]
MKLSFVGAALLISVLSTDAQAYSESQSYGVSSNYDPQFPVPQQSNYENPPNPMMETYYGSVPPAQSTQPLPGDTVQTESVPAAPPSYQHFAGPASFPPSQVSSTAYAQSARASLPPRPPCPCAAHAPAAGAPRPPCPCALHAPAGGAPRPPCPCALHAPAAGAPRAPCAGAPRAPCAGAPRAPCASAPRAPAAGVPRAPCACARAPCACASHAPAVGVPHAPAASRPRAPCACVRGPCACARGPASAAKRTSAQYTRVAFPQLGPSASLSSDAKLPGTSELPASEGPESAVSGTPGNLGEKTSTSTDQTSQKSSLNQPQIYELHFLRVKPEPTFHTFSSQLP